LVTAIQTIHVKPAFKRCFQTLLSNFYFNQRPYTEELEELRVDAMTTREASLDVDADADDDDDQRLKKREESEQPLGGAVQVDPGLTQG